MSYTIQQQQWRQLHANRTSLCRIKRKENEYCRQYPVQIVFKDGSTITVRYQIPREIIKFPLLLEECETVEQRKEWLLRRKPKEVINIKKDDTNVKYDPMQYLKTAKQPQMKKAIQK